MKRTIKGCKGTLASLIKVNHKKYEVAVKIALGKVLDYIVVNSD